MVVKKCHQRLYLLRILKKKIKNNNVIYFLWTIKSIIYFSITAWFCMLTCKNKTKFGIFFKQRNSVQTLSNKISWIRKMWWSMLKMPTTHYIINIFSLGQEEDLPWHHSTKKDSKNRLFPKVYFCLTIKIMTNITIRIVWKVFLYRMCVLQAT